MSTNSHWKDDAADEDVEEQNEQRKGNRQIEVIVLDELVKLPVLLLPIFNFLLFLVLLRTPTEEDFAAQVSQASLTIL